MLYKFLLLLLYLATLYGSDSDDAGYITDADEREKTAASIITMLRECAPQGYTLFATGVTESEGSFVVYKKSYEQAYLLKNLFEKVVKEVPIERVDIEMNVPPCRCIDCNTIQMKLNLRGRTKFLSLTNQNNPTHGVLADEPAILSIHEPPGVRSEAKVSLLPIETGVALVRSLK